MKVDLNLSNHATKVDLKNAIGVDKSVKEIVKKVDLASLKSEVDKLNIDKLKNEPTGLNRSK